MKNPLVDKALLKQIENEYLSRYFVPQETIATQAAERQEKKETVLYRKNKI